MIGRVETVNEVQRPGRPIPSPAIFDKTAQKFRRPVASFSEARHIPASGSAPGCD